MDRKKENVVTVKEGAGQENTRKRPSMHDENKNKLQKQNKKRKNEENKEIESVTLFLTEEAVDIQK